MKPEYPRIPFTPNETKREEHLKTLGRAFQKLMESIGNNTALKGGTGLRFQIGLPRPSTDLDFEGDERINVRRAVKKALKLAFGERAYKIGWNWLKRGGVEIRPTQAGRRGDASKIDYQKMGSFPDMPLKVPMGKTERRDGINIYNEKELVHKKLGTMIGPGRTRQRARDIYDTGWLVNEKPELINQGDRQLLKEWMEQLTPADTDNMKDKLRRNRLTARVDAETVVSMLKKGIERLQVEPATRDPRSRGTKGEIDDESTGVPPRGGPRDAKRSDRAEHPHEFIVRRPSEPAANDRRTTEKRERSSSRHKR